jgi:hypothetical protein
MWIYRDGTRTGNPDSYKVLSTTFQDLNCNIGLIRSATHIARMSWRTHFPFPLSDEAWLYISAYIPGQHSKHEPLTISVRSIKDRYFLRKSKCNVCPLMENNRSRFVQRNGNDKRHQDIIMNLTSLLGLYEYDCRFQSDGSAAYKSVSFRCRCCT